MTLPPDATADDGRLYALLERVVNVSAAERERILAASPPDLASEVRKILTRDATDDGFLAGPPDGGPVLPVDMPPAIGTYRLVEILGEGGMGRVFLAEQDEPVRRRVAVKVLRFAAAGPESVARFEAERHAMGRLDHPNVGKILEAGTTEDGHPFFAMELVDGSPITTYCDDRRLDLEARLHLFVEVCRGVEHAHGKLLLHRDLKPSNILVAEVDGRPLPKIIDFGIAKSLEGALTDRPLATVGQILCTPAYASPEALEGVTTDLDVRADVYSLGVVLYELLTGNRPYETADGALAAILRRITEGEAKRPSTRVSSLDLDRRTALAARRGSDAGTLTRRLRGDLDGVVMKAIARDRNERYSSAAELAADLERYLRNEPVTARTPTAAYVLRKLVRRHRAAATAVAAVVLAGLLGIAGTSAGLARARRAEAEARRETREAVEARIDAEQVVDFLVGIFRGSGLEDSARKPPAERTALELLDAGAERLGEDLAEQPLTRARLAYTIAGVYRQLGLFERARRQAEEALALQLATPGATPGDVARTRLELAQTLIWTEDTEPARGLLEKALKTVPQSDDPRDLLLRARLLDSLGRLERRRRNFAAAERHAEDGIAIYREHPDLDQRDLATALNNLAGTYFAQQRWSEAEQRFREALEILDRLYEPGHPRRTRAADNLGAAIASQGRLDEAAPLFEKALAEQRAVLPPGHPALANSLHNLAQLNVDLGRPKQAEALAREALAIREEALGPNHRKTAWSLDCLARALGDQGRTAEAMATQRRALKIRERVLPPDDPTLARSLEHLSRLAAAMGDPAAARDFERRAEAIRGASREE